LAGSYCIKQGTSYDPGASQGFPCREGEANCASDYTVEFEDTRGNRGSNQKRGCLPQGAVCGKDDTCCEVRPTGCEDGVNCFPPAACGAGGCVHPDEGGTETTYEVTRNECDEGDTC